MFSVGDKSMSATLVPVKYTIHGLSQSRPRPSLLLTQEASSYHNLTCSDPFCASLHEETTLWASDKTGSLKAS